MKKINKKGFTLIELLAVIVVLGIILAIAIPSITGIIEESKKNSFIKSAEMIASEFAKQQTISEMEDDLLIGACGDSNVIGDGFDLDTATDDDDTKEGLQNKMDGIDLGYDVANYDADASYVCMNGNDVYLKLVGDGDYEGYTVTGNAGSIK